MQVKEPKRKRNLQLSPTAPLPVNNTSTDTSKIQCNFDGYSIVVNDKEHMKKLYMNGFFGKMNLSKNFHSFDPHKGDKIIRKRQFDLRKKIASRIKSKSQFKIIVVPDSDSENDDYFSNLKAVYEIDNVCISEKLFLGLEEAFFLLNGLNCIDIFADKGLLTTDEAWTLFSSTDQYFVQNYVVYHYFRSKQWVVKPGLKFGGDFLLYKDGPSVYHASYVVIIDVVNPENLERRTSLCRRKMSVIEIVGLNRLCENCGKELIICQLMWPENITGRKYTDIQDISVNETLARRWIPSKERDNGKKEKTQ
ncbi:tRNA-splicing endonuclease subunit Sen2 [Agrilus planipennis]|uniref:tRNA-splicing endonuclease subunit Sen2 n=1 Tax=Agrilus planipennis TaxID=224129 RepID=A0A1W4WVH5_AGRPL|nr:tRNA-splicing endonuclease subunit Sen2 [Agrilus planipennis]